MEYLKSNSLICDEQFGFVGGRSTTLQLLNALDAWTKAADSRIQTDIILMDFKKAFDTVPHKRLLKKLYGYGFRDPLLGWLKSFLHNRQQRVGVNGCFSSWHNITSGIPQGSVLGPVLFIIYINDLPSRVGSNALLFADDTKLYRPICTKMDQQLLQDDLYRLQSWSDHWLLRFHPKKCQVLSINPKDQFPYHMLDESKKSVQFLSHVSETRDLGVIIDSQLSFDGHITLKIKKANMILSLIRRTFTYIDANNLIVLFKSLVRPHLEFSNTVWHPFKKKHLVAIENVQRRATKLIPTLKDLSYTERLKRLNLPTLTFRRLRGDMIEVFKIMNNYYDSRVSSSILKLHVHASAVSTRGHKLKLFLPRANTELRRNFFSHRVVRHWNSLPEDVVTAPSINSFKNRLDTFWSSKLLRFDHEVDSH